MSVEPPSQPPAAPTIDLTGGDETPAAAAGRIIGGLLTGIAGSVIALALFVGYVAGAFIPPVATLFDILGDFALYGAALAAGIAITGFTLMRRGRKVRAQEAAEEAAYLARVQAEAKEQAARPQDPPPATGSETHL